MHSSRVAFRVGRGLDCMMAEAAVPEGSSEYDQVEKKLCRLTVIEHAVNSLTKDRANSVCVQRDYVRRLWKQFCESEEVQRCFSEEERNKIEKEITNWELLHDSRVGTKKPSDLRVLYLSGHNPVNDLEVLIQNGVLPQNVWGIEKDSKTFSGGLDAIKKSTKLESFNFGIANCDMRAFLKDFGEGPFDIIYFDACGALPSPRQNTLKVVGEVFLYDKLTSPGALITNFSFPPEQSTHPDDAANLHSSDEERKEITSLAAKYLNHRLPQAEFGDKTDEEVFSEFLTTQVADSACLFAPALKMLNQSQRKSLMDQSYVSRNNFLRDVNSYDLNSSEPPPPPPGIDDIKEILTTPSQERLKSPQLKNLCEQDAKIFSLQEIGSSLNSEAANDKHCKTWVDEIFPDWRSLSCLKNKHISSLILTSLLGSSLPFILRFGNEDMMKCLQTLFEGDNLLFPSSLRSEADISEAVSSLGGLLYEKTVQPSFLVINKQLRCTYIAKDRQMFTDVFVFDKCRYVYDQLPTVFCLPFSVKKKQQLVTFRMAVDGLRKHLRSICWGHLYKYCSVSSMNSLVDGGPNNLCFPKRLQIPVMFKSTYNFPPFSIGGGSPEGIIVPVASVTVTVEGTKTELLDTNCYFSGSCPVIENKASHYIPIIIYYY